jgi:hypothetical protein
MSEQFPEAIEALVLAAKEAERNFEPAEVRKREEERGRERKREEERGREEYYDSKTCMCCCRVCCRA